VLPAGLVDGPLSATMTSADHWGPEAKTLTVSFLEDDAEVLTAGEADGAEVAVRTPAPRSAPSAGDRDPSEDAITV